jgi:Lar family restriction alleviation protein
MTTKLKPCPFCGGEATVSYEKFFETYHVGCEDNGCPVIAGTDGDSEEDAIGRWNRRASGWRSCKDSHPEIGQTVLIALKPSSHSELYHLLSAEYEEHGYKYRGIDISPDWWMELPDLPEEAEEWNG